MEKLGIKTAAAKVEVAEAILEKYVGTYQLAPGFNIEITRSGKQLYGQGTGQPRFELFAKSDTEFYLTVVDAQIKFKVNGEVVESLMLHQSGQDIPGKKVK